MRRRLSLIAMGVLAIAGCAHEGRVCPEPSATRCPPTCSVEIRSPRSPYCMTPGGSPCGGATKSGPSDKPAAAAPPRTMPFASDKAPEVPDTIERLPDIVPKEPPSTPAPAPVTGVDHREIAQVREATTVLVGEIEKWRDTLRVRFAPLEIEDPHGGRATVVGYPGLRDVNDGQRVRVLGLLMPSEDRAHPPVLHVQSLEIVD